MSNLAGFKAALLGGGARANQFRVQLTFPAALSISNKTASLAASQFLCKASSLPAINIGTAQTYYQGRMVPLAGERTFDPWSVVIYNDNNFLMRNALEDWSNAMNNFNDNTGVTSPLAYKADATVEQLDRNGSVVKTYKFINMFPIAIGDIALDFGTNDQVEEFSATFAYEHYQTEAGKLINVGVNVGGFGINL